ncbi:MAG: excinuclease ABC subunit UvrA [Planctomycetota bacterium]
MAFEDEWIEIQGARTHNLRAVDVNLPRGKIVVFTGVSGSGKSSLAFDTLFAEGQRRYMESLSPYVRRFLDQMPRPDVDRIVGLPPTLSISQSHRLGTSNPRSTVATLTEIHDYLRVLYARCGDVFCYQCGEPLGTQSVRQILDAIEALPTGEKIHILAPLVRGQKGAHREEFQLIRREGFVRARLDGTLLLVDSPPAINPDVPHDLEMVVDRQVVRPGIRDRLAESIETALKHGGGTVIISRDLEGDWNDTVFSTRFACLRCQISYRELEPRTFSFNSPYGACPLCHGLGTVASFSLDSLIPDPGKSLAKGAIAVFTTESGSVRADFKKDLKQWAENPAWLDTPYQALSELQKESLWNGTPTFRGVGERIEQLDHEQRDGGEDTLATYRQSRTCPDCHGARLAPEGRSVRVGGLAIHEFVALPIDAAATRIKSLAFTGEREILSQQILRELTSRLDFLVRVGVGYVELDRPIVTLSGGEAQRIRLAGCVGSGLNGVCYVLDEPSIGLHPRDTQRLLDVLEELRDRDNTVLLVEHDEDAIRQADLVVDLGPGAGPHGGSIVAMGPMTSFLESASLTADYLAGRRMIGPAKKPISRDVKQSQKSKSAATLTLSDVTHRNLKNVTLRVPLGQLVTVTGVSGSGKSSLVMEVLVPAVSHALGRGGPIPGRHGNLAGAENLARVLEVDQSPIGRSPRSTPASYAELLDPIRDVFAKTKMARTRGYNASRFSPNHKSGQCAECKGLGAQKVDIAFLPDYYAPCPICQGKRFNRATLEVKFRDRSIADVLAMTVEESADFFENHPKIHRILATLKEVGVGYLRLDQWATTLSGGESQRLKLATELARAVANPAAHGMLGSLFVLDEPTTGLHFHDIAQLLELLRRLVAEGNTVLVIEHHLDFIRASDWVIDLGPEGGAEGGHILVEGPPSMLADTAASATGRALKERLTSNKR